MKRASLLVVVTTSTMFWAACAGRATLGPLDDEPYSSSNSGGGNGGSAGAGGNGGSGGVSDTVVATSVMASVGTTTVTTTTGPGHCDGSGQCQMCVDCATQGPCNAAFQNCIGNPECIAFGDCLDNCGGGMGCFPQCVQQHPGGWEDYIDAVQCIVCDQCEQDCGGQAPPQLCDL